MSAVHDLDRVQFIATKPMRAEATAEWEPWLAGHSSTLDGALWRLLDPAPAGRPGAGHSHVVHLPAPRVADHDRAIATMRAEGGTLPHAEIRRDEWTRSGGPIVVDSADATGLIVAEVLCADPARVDEWDAWYDAEHLPDMMESGAFTAGSRWRRSTTRTGSTNHLTVYEISGRTVTEAVEASAAVMAPLIARGRKHECHTGGLTWALELVR